MMPTNASAAPTDAELVAYLDGELSPADSVRIGQRLAADPLLLARLDHLMKGGRPFRTAFEPLLAEAPVEKLNDILSAALSRPDRPPLSQSFLLRHWPPAAAAAIAMLVMGAAFDRIAITAASKAQLASAPQGETADEWRRVIAQYLTLYTRDTLTAISDPGDTGRKALESVGARLGLSLEGPRSDLPNLTFKRADLYEYDGKPLGFLAYLDPTSGPIALCIVEAPGKIAHTVERRNGMNIVYWSQGRHSFMLIGHAPVEQLQALATSVGTRLNTPDSHG